MSEPRQMRVVTRGDRWFVQYGSYASNGGPNRRFLAIYEWPAADYVQANCIVARENINVALSPPAADAHPIVEQRVVARSINEAVPSMHALLRAAIGKLPDPLPSVDQLHEQMPGEMPAPHKGGRQFYLYLPEGAYGLLCAMAVAAGTTRNRIIEALILTAGEDIWHTS